jgi:hypothetical protein
MVCIVNNDISLQRSVYIYAIVYRVITALLPRTLHAETFICETLVLVTADTGRSKWCSAYAGLR